jgi:hypothetical protein
VWSRAKPQLYWLKASPLGRSVADKRGRKAEAC